MSVLETVQDQLLEAITAGEGAVLNGVRALTQKAQPIAGKLPDVPFADHLPNPVDVVDTAFGFAERLLASQKEFAVKLVGGHRPLIETVQSAVEDAVEPAVKAVTKAAKAPTKAN